MNNQLKLNFVAGIGLLWVLAGCGGTSSQITVADLKERVAILASDSLEGRRTGEPGAEKAARYIAGEFAKIGLKAFGNTSDGTHESYYQHFEFSEKQFDSTKTEKTKGMNVIGMLEGTDPELKNTVIVIGAHYDHLGFGGRNAMDTSKAIHYGADDNASGTAGLIELAEYFAKNKEHVKRSLVFMGFSGEEEGLFGSAHYTKEPYIPLERTEAMLNMDMIGRLNDSSVLIVEGMGTSPIWRDMITSYEESKPFRLRLKPAGIGPSDHSPFYRKGIPVLFFFTGIHRDYHKASDTKDKVNYTGQKAVLDLVRATIETIASRTDSIPYTVVPIDTTKKVSAFKVYVGGVPDYGYDGEGLKISDITPDSPAQRAGLKAEDVIVKFGETTIKNIYDYTGVLSKYKPDDVVQLVVKRAGETITLPLTLGTKRDVH